MGFTKNSAPLNAAFILEEARREALDIGKLLTIVLLDAKSAFDVVVHTNLLKKLYHLGIQDKHWNLIKSLHTNASSAIKFIGHILCILYSCLILTVVAFLTMDLCICCRGQHLVYLFDELLVVY
jgi:hypothetical protein